MNDISPTLVAADRQRRAYRRAFENDSRENLEQWLALSKKVSKTARYELSELQLEMSQLMTAVIEISYPCYDEELEELALKQQVDKNAEIQEIAQHFCDINDIRIGVEQDILRAEAFLSAKEG